MESGKYLEFHIKNRPLALFQEILCFEDDVTKDFLKFKSAFIKKRIYIITKKNVHRKISEAARSEFP